MNLHAPPENGAGNRQGTSPDSLTTLNPADDNANVSSTQPRKGNVFSIMNNIRDHCELASDYRDLLFTLATYCDADGICWPGNDELSRAARKPRRTLQRMLNHLVTAKHIKILSSGRGRDQKRVISLRYAQAVPKNVIPIAVNAPPMSGAFKCASSTYETCTGNCHTELPDTPKGRTRRTRKSASSARAALEKYDEAERQLINIYHAKLCDKESGWLRVTKYADSVVNALATWLGEPEIFAELCDDAANDGISSPPKTKSIVRLIWSNY
jgi:hypothetical protein